MNLTFLIYLVGIIDNIITLFIIVDVCLLILVFIAVYSFSESSNDKERVENKNCLKCFLILTIIFSLLTACIPNSKTISAMYLIPKIAENKEVKEIPEKALKLLNGKLDEWISNINKEVKE